MGGKSQPQMPPPVEPEVYDRTADAEVGQTLLGGGVKKNKK